MQKLQALGTEFKYLLATMGSEDLKWQMMN